MYVCNCRGIRESDISATIQLGATTLKALRHTLGVGSCCGKCVSDVRDLLHREVEHSGNGKCKGCAKCSGNSQPDLSEDMTPALC